ncbi:MAG: hypothetical protein U9N59_15935 [Campylobacterota bacterium]|nr:hypothetical protein [Campylobacterota bacterium]
MRIFKIILSILLITTSVFAFEKFNVGDNVVFKEGATFCLYKKDSIKSFNFNGNYSEEAKQLFYEQKCFLANKTNLKTLNNSSWKVKSKEVVPELYMNTLPIFFLNLECDGVNVWLYVIEAYVPKFARPKIKIVR